MDHRFDALGRRIDRMEGASTASHHDTAAKLDQLRQLVGEQAALLKDHERRIAVAEGREQALAKEFDTFSEVTGQHHARQEASMAVKQEVSRDWTDRRRFWITTTISLATAIVGLLAGYFMR